MICFAACVARAVTQAAEWYSWQPQQNANARLCGACWLYWKKYGGLRQPARTDNERAHSRPERGAAAQQTAASAQAAKSPAKNAIKCPVDKCMRVRCAFASLR